MVRGRLRRTDPEAPTVPPAAASSVPPHNEEAELGLLSSILVDYERVLDLCAAKHVAPDCFYNPTYRRIYEVARELRDANAPVNQLTLAGRLRELGELDRLGGEVMLHDIVQYEPTAENAAYYIEQLIQKRMLRELLAQAQRVVQECLTPSGEDAREIVNRAEAAIFKIRDMDLGLGADWRDQIETVSAEIAELISSRGSRLTGLSTGYRTLDEILLGLQPSEMIVLAARPSMGKTSLAMNIAENVATGYNPKSEYPTLGRQPRAVAVFSLEMSAASLARRMLCSRAEMEWSRIVKGYCSAKDQQAIAAAARELQKLPFYVDDTAGLDIKELWARARRLHRLHNLGLIVVDYLQLLHCSGMDRNNRQQEIEAISGMLKGMAKELKVPVLVLSQLNRQPEARDRSGVPRLADLRDSGSIEQDADVVLLLRRPIRNKHDPRYKEAELTPGLAIVDVAKQRNGRTGEVSMLFKEEHTRFYDLSGEVGMRPSEGGVDE